MCSLILSVQLKSQCRFCPTFSLPASFGCSVNIYTKRLPFCFTFEPLRVQPCWLGSYQWRAEKDWLLKYLTQFATHTGLFMMSLTQFATHTGLFMMSLIQFATHTGLFMMSLIQFATHTVYLCHWYCLPLTLVCYDITYTVCHSHWSVYGVIDKVCHSHWFVYIATDKVCHSH